MVRGIAHNSTRKLAMFGKVVAVTVEFDGSRSGITLR